MERARFLDFAAEHGMRPEVEPFAMKDIDDAFARKKKEDVRFRHLIDMARLEPDEDAKEIDPPVRGAVVG